MIKKHIRADLIKTGIATALETENFKDFLNYRFTFRVPTPPGSTMAMTLATEDGAILKARRFTGHVYKKKFVRLSL
jgi:hypothetical protein